MLELEGHKNTVIVQRRCPIEFKLALFVLIMTIISNGIQMKQKIDKIFLNNLYEFMKFRWHTIDDMDMMLSLRRKFKVWYMLFILHNCFWNRTFQKFYGYANGANWMLFKMYFKGILFIIETGTKNLKADRLCMIKNTSPVTLFYRRSHIPSQVVHKLFVEAAQVIIDSVYPFY